MKVRNNWGEQKKKKKKCCVSLIQAQLLLKVKRQFQYKKSKGQDSEPAQETKCVQHQKHESITVILGRKTSLSTDTAAKKKTKKKKTSG